MELASRHKREDTDLSDRRASHSETLLAGVVVEGAAVRAVAPPPGQREPGLRGLGAAPGPGDAEAVGAAGVGAALVGEGELTLAVRVRPGHGETRGGGGATEPTAQPGDVSCCCDLGGRVIVRGRDITSWIRFCSCLRRAFI